MTDFKYSIPFFRSTLTSFNIAVVIVLLIPLFLPVQSAFAQSTDPATCIKELKEGTLILRIPTNKSKIDTLTAMVNRSTDPDKKARLEKQLNETIQERDTLLADYVFAFKTNFDFCKVGYYFDYDADDLNTASYYNMEGERIAVGDLSEKPLYYLYFERTTGSKIDALVVYNRNIQKVPSPFPNDFSRGGLNVLFLGLSGKSFPIWRVGKINKQFHKYYGGVLAREHYEAEAEKK